MDENPYQAPHAPDETPVSTNAALGPMAAWAIIGFVIGTLAVAPFILSFALRDKLLGGAVFGGPPGAILGLLRAIRRRRSS
jgi:hypothetical protein